MQNPSSKNATLRVNTEPISLEDMHDLTDVFMNALHVSFSGRAIDGRALAGSLLSAALGVLRDIGVDDPKSSACASYVDLVRNRSSRLRYRQPSNFLIAAVMATNRAGSIFSKSIRTLRFLSLKASFPFCPAIPSTD